MTIYHFIVIAIIGVSLAVPAYFYPRRSIAFRIAVGLAVALVLTAILVLFLYIYFAIRGEA